MHSQEAFTFVTCFLCFLCPLLDTKQADKLVQVNADNATFDPFGLVRRCQEKLLASYSGPYYCTRTHRFLEQQ